MYCYHFIIIKYWYYTYIGGSNNSGSEGSTSGIIAGVIGGIVAVIVVIIIVMIIILIVVCHRKKGIMLN